jgi:hypothetical protein
MRFPTSGRVCALFILIATPWANAGAEVICPDVLDVQQSAAPPDDEWTVSYSQPPLRLVGITIFDGPPSQNRRIRPFSTRNTKGELRIAWRLPESKRNFHLQCGYERTTATLVTILPPGVNSCEAVFDRRVQVGPEDMAVKRMVCM